MTQDQLIKQVWLWLIINLASLKLEECAQEALRRK